MSDKPLISVIVPVYNVERYLPRCIESILGQTYTNFELILVDDGTPDRSGIICDRYAEKDSRIKVIHKENGGVSSARNAGIDAAQGEWITFIDSDDWVSDKYLEKLESFTLFSEIDFVMACIEYRGIKIHTPKIKTELLDFSKNDSADMERMLNIHDIVGPCSKMFKTKTLKDNSVYFLEDVHFGEDEIFIYEYLKCCNRIYFSDSTIYYYNKLNELSASHNLSYTTKLMEWRLYAVFKQAELLEHHKIAPNTREKIVAQKTLKCVKSCMRICVNSLKPNDARKEIWKAIQLLKKCDVVWENVLNYHTDDVFARAVVDENVAGIYTYSRRENKRGLVRKNIKLALNKVLGKFTERYRDGLVKFKF